MYAVHGVLLFYVSLDVQRYLPIIRCLALLGIAFGVAIVAVDAAVGLPLWWTVGEGPFPFALGVALLWLAKRAEVGGQGRDGAHGEL